MYLTVNDSIFLTTYILFYIYYVLTSITNFLLRYAFEHPEDVKPEETIEIHVNPLLNNVIVTNSEKEELVKYYNNQYFETHYPVNFDFSEIS